MDNALQELSQFATLAGLLGGFGFTAILQLLSIDRKGKLLTATIVAFTAATLMFLLALLMFVLTYASATELGELNEALDNLGTIALLIALGAVFVLEAAIGLAGWIRSRATGIATTIFAGITICLTVMVIFTALSHFM